MPATSSPTRVAVLGAGITGLTAAWHLQRYGFDAVVFERSARVGGVIGAVRSDGWLHELGPNSMLEGSSSGAKLIDDIGLARRRIYAADAAKHRYIVRGGQLAAMPTSPKSFITTSLFSWRAKLKLLGEPWRRRGPEDHEESVADFVVRRLGREFLDYAVNPLVGGVYAGDPETLSVRHAFPKLRALEQDHGSLLRGALKRRNMSGGPKGRIFSFPNGLGEIPTALAAALGSRVRLRHTVLSVRRADDGWHIGFETAGARHVGRFGAVVCALPADTVAALNFENVPAAPSLRALREIAHPPVVSVFTGYRRKDVRHPLDGFGMLVPQVEHRLILGTLFSSTLFPNRAPEGYVGLTSFVGGMREPELTQLNERELVRIVDAELRRFLGVSGAPVFTHVQSWPRAIPQYNLGYQRFKDAVSAAEISAPGLFIGGNCRDGISLGNCIDSGRRLAEAVGGYAPTSTRPPSSTLA
jgi:protoporphyrinogen/coproporphyrinogen III oxidase